MEGVVYGFEPLEEAEQSDNDGQALRGGVAF
jgi:hypothetical protein